MADALALNVGTFLAICTLSFSVLLLAVSILSYRRLGNPRFLFIGLAFAGFAGKGAYTTYQAIGPGAVDLIASGFDFGVLALMYLSIAKR